MCSIIGVYSFSYGIPVDQLRASVEAGLQVLHNRGPDESSVEVVSDFCVLGGNRLIIRGALGIGSMPFRLDGSLCYYNGEIYNFRDWDTCAVSDGSVILPAYKEEGLKAFTRFDAEFAIAIWDNSARRIVLARDPFGTRPLYFSLNRQRLLWASSASAIDAMEPHARCHAVQSPVSQHTTTVQEPYTSFAGIWALPPGHAVIATRVGVHLHCFHHWRDVEPTSMDLDSVFLALEESLQRRLDYDGILAIPMSGGIDSGIIAFAADRLRVRYHVFSVIEMFGHATEETETIYKRIDRLRNPADITLLSCGEVEYYTALREMYLPDYYDYETYDNGNVLVHTVCSEVRRCGLRVIVDGGGGDELFHGYKFRADFVPVPGWPRTWENTPYYYSLYSTLLAWTAKTERAGGHFSIETRFPYQSVHVMNAAASLRITDKLKWPLREFLLRRTNYGSATPLDLNGKYGFSIKHRDLERVVKDLRAAWRAKTHVDEALLVQPMAFPFQIGCDTRSPVDQLPPASSGSASAIPVTIKRHQGVQRPS